MCGLILEEEKKANEYISNDDERRQRDPYVCIWPWYMLMALAQCLNLAATSRY